MAYKESVEQDDEDVRFIKFEKVGDTFEGVLKEVKPSNLYGHIYTFDCNNEKHILIGKTQLNRLMSSVSVGNLVKISLTELRKLDKGRSLKLFRVQFDPDYGKAIEESVI